MAHMRIYPSLCMTFNPEAWSDDRVKRYTNCQGYALDVPMLAGEPGGLRYGGINPHRKTDIPLAKAKPLAHMARFDGLIPTKERAFHPEREHVVAILGAVAERPWPEVENSIGDKTYYLYHLYRLDGDRTWSGKNGGKAPVQVPKDKSLTEHFTQDLESAHFFNIKTQHAGFFRFPESGLLLKKNLALR